MSFRSTRFLDKNFKELDLELFVYVKVFVSLIVVFGKCIQKVSIRFQNIRTLQKISVQNIRQEDIHFIKNCSFQKIIRFKISGYLFFVNGYLVVTNTFPENNTI